MVCRLVYADDSFLFRSGTAALLERVPEVELVGVVDNPTALLEAVRGDRPDAVLTEIPMPPTRTREWIDAAKRIRAEHPGTGVVVFSESVEAADLVELLAGGAAGLGCLLKDRVSSLDQLVRALVEVSRGGYAVDPYVVEGLLRRRAARATSPLVSLTPREQDVLAEMATGRSNSAIATTLSMSERAVEKHSTSVFQKLGVGEEDTVNRRVSAVLAFLHSGGRPLTP